MTDRLTFPTYVGGPLDGEPVRQVPGSVHYTATQEPDGTFTQVTYHLNTLGMAGSDLVLEVWHDPATDRCDVYARVWRELIEHRLDGGGGGLNHDREPPTQIRKARAVENECTRNGFIPNASTSTVPVDE